MGFCTRCGKQIEEGQLCGYSDSAQSAASESDKFFDRAKTWPVSATKPLKVISILIVFVILFSAIGAELTKPMNTARGYSQAKANGNWEKAYKYFSLKQKDETDFINKGSYIKAQANMNITGFDISERSSSTFEAKYYLNDSAPEQNEIIELDKKGRSLLFFDAYKVGTRDVIVDNYEMWIPSNATVYMDGIQLDQNVIPQIFAGQHEFRLEHPACDTIEETIQINRGNAYYAVPLLQLVDSVKTGLANKTQEDYKRIVASAIEGKSFEALGLSYSEEFFDDIKNSYDRFASTIHKKENESGYKSIDIIDFIDNSAQTEWNDYGTYLCELQANFSYVYVSYDWRGNSSAEPGASSNWVRFAYVYENGTWVLQGMYIDS